MVFDAYQKKSSKPLFEILNSSVEGVLGMPSLYKSLLKRTHKQSLLTKIGLLFAIKDEQTDMQQTAGGGDCNQHGPLCCVSPVTLGCAGVVCSCSHS